MSEEQPWLLQNSQPVCGFTDRITTNLPSEFSHPKKPNDVSKNTVKAKSMQLDIKPATQQVPEFQGEEFLYYTQPAKAPSEELPNPLKTGVRSDLGNFLQSAPVKSDESTLITPTVQSEALQQCLLKLPEVPSVLGNPSQRPSDQSLDFIGHVPVSASKLDKLHTIKPVQLSETVKSPIKATFQSEWSREPSYAAITSSDGLSGLEHTTALHSEGTFSHIVTGQSLPSSHTTGDQTEVPFESLRMDVVNLDAICSLAEKYDVWSVKDVQRLQVQSIKSAGDCDSLRTAKDQPEDVLSSPHTSVIHSKDYGCLSNAPSCQTVKLCASKMAQSVQTEDSSDLQSAAVDDLIETRQAMSCHSNVPHQSRQAREACPTTTKATAHQEDCTAEPTTKLAAQFAESYNAKQASTGDSEEIYLSCGSHWSDSVTANKVAVEGDLMASII